jgi:hypothetical protein
MSAVSLITPARFDAVAASVEPKTGKIPRSIKVGGFTPVISPFESRPPILFIFVR